MAATKPLIKKGIFALVLLVIAVGFYYLTIWATPYYVQHKFAEKTLGVVNTPQFGNQPDAENQS